MMMSNKSIDKLFIYWLTTGIVLIFSMIIVGGLTRLTNSGLSITQWELFRGILPPLNNADWNNYFDLYKEIPQYKLLNSDMTLNEFKIIYYWEYAHRIFGRLIGLFFIIPLAYFHFILKIEFRKVLPFYIISFLILIQGIVGWYMVKSGLVNDITVSHYRLSMHLSLAVIIISMIFWQLINLKRKTFKVFFNFSYKKLPFIFLIILIFLQIILGAFVSGLDAGKIYQTWPLMGLTYFPDDLNYMNLINFENHSLVQFYHRNNAYLIFIYSVIMGLIIFLSEKKFLYKPLIIFLIFLFLQICLGIFTLISNLNIVLASGHQILSIILMLSAINLYYSCIK